MYYIKNTLLLALILFLTNCSLKQDYSKVTADLGMRGTGSVGVSSKDVRSYIVSGDKQPSFVGLVRANVGIPYDAHTARGEALSSLFSKVACNSLTKSGFSCAVGGSGNKKIQINIRKWKSDTYQSTNLVYDLELRVLNSAGRLLASNRTKGSENIGYSFLAPASVPVKQMPIKMKEKLEVLFSSDKIRKALS